MKSNLFVKLSFIIILININIFVSAELCKDDFQNDGSKTRAFNQNIEMDKPNIVIILVDDMVKYLISFKFTDLKTVIFFF